MKTIYKYKLFDSTNIQDEIIIEMPSQAKILTIDKQDDTVYLWAYVDTDYSSIPYTCRIIGTGWDLKSYYLSHISMEFKEKEFEEFINTFKGTIQLNGFVWHLFIYV